MLNEGNQKHNFISSSGSGTVINYGSGSDFLTSYGSYGSGSGSTTLVGTIIMPNLGGGRGRGGLRKYKMQSDFWLSSVKSQWG
jgi:hypothetical protein